MVDMPCFSKNFKKKEISDTEKKPEEYFAIESCIFFSLKSSFQ